MLFSIPTIIYLAIVNTVAVFLVVYDKIISKLPRGSIRRIPEKTFVQISFVGGGVGTLLAMLAVRHKTGNKKPLLLKVAVGAVLWSVILAVAVILP
ncbi:MAG: DUF1294 domain-containing protein [Clostridia bacterium]|nr:DUF1294 domain-containing protein [Clostridia bacterium]